MMISDIHVHAHGVIRLLLVIISLNNKRENYNRKTIDQLHTSENTVPT